MPEWAFFRERTCVQSHGSEKSTAHSGKYKSLSMARKEKKTWKEQEMRLTRQAGVGTQRVHFILWMRKAKETFQQGKGHS